jgi:uncharacterized protein YqeY
MINIDEKIKEALLSKDEIKTKVYRAIKAEILKFKTQKNAPQYTDTEEIKLVNNMVKAHLESIDMYSKAGREDLVGPEQEELDLLSSLLPEKASEETISNTCSKYLEQNPELTKKDMGKVIKHLKELFPVNDGKEIANIVKSKL